MLMQHKSCLPVGVNVIRTWCIISPILCFVHIFMPCSYSVNLFFHLPLVEYLVELREYGPVYSTWGGLEVELAEPLEGVSACIGNCCTALEELSEDMTEDFLPVLREYILYAESMKVKRALWQEVLSLCLPGSSEFILF